MWCSTLYAGVRRLSSFRQSSAPFSTEAHCDSLRWRRVDATPWAAEQRRIGSAGPPPSLVAARVRAASPAWRVQWRQQVGTRRLDSARCEAGSSVEFPLFVRSSLRCDAPLFALSFAPAHCAGEAGENSRNKSELGAAMSRLIWFWCGPLQQCLFTKQTCSWRVAEADTE